ncbi:hypothetical protein BP00DRAFT_13175 [Aspergillus indologenus CBS 114.80]|uniref:Uncharacterized protein n=1 Tax=Aspergillus indologenus CBS 114.80 TaxID=1450541 RepID=A0A2V5HV89_9EURO|nr:hypothetical protein BP00DRAFT_13175 [Aspergillus indologenus CBS 114.80]
MFLIFFAYIRSGHSVVRLRFGFGSHHLLRTLRRKAATSVPARRTTTSFPLGLQRVQSDSVDDDIPKFIFFFFFFFYLLVSEQYQNLSFT